MGSPELVMRTIVDIEWSKQPTTNPEVAVRVKVAIDRDVKWHAKKLEESETGRKEPEKKTSEEAVASSDPQVELEEYARVPTSK